MGLPALQAQSVASTHRGVAHTVPRARSVQQRAAAMGAASSTSKGGTAVPPAAPQQPPPPSAFSACARPEAAAAMRTGYDDLGGWPTSTLPIVYDACYNIGFFGVEKLHPFDSHKYEHVLALLENRNVLSASQLAPAHEASRDVLRDVHTERYLQRLHSSSFTVAQVTELVPLVLLPPFILRKRVLSPMATMTGGTMLAAALAVECGWAINLGGGFHHACHDSGGGWCPFADLNLALRRLRAASGGRIRRVMVIDLDVHQGNGVARCKQHFQDADCFIVDVYNVQSYPWDTPAKQAINVARELRSGTGDAEYLEAVRSALEEAFAACPKPDAVLYNAGTDILAGDPLGRLSVSQEGVVRRDQMVWQAALQAGSPICMVLSGGYSPASIPCIAASIENLCSTFGLTGGGGNGGSEGGAAGAEAAGREL